MTTTIKLCSLEGCNKKRHGKGFCRNHHYRFWKHGDPLKGGASNGSPAKFVEESIKDPGPDCIIWPFFKSKAGYGQVEKDGNVWPAHRFALILFTGVDHKHLNAAHGPCNTPACINPLHLSWKTQKENCADKHRDGTAQIGERGPNAKLTEDEVLKILQDPRSQRKIAADYGVHQTQISLIKRGRNWAHLTANVS